MYGLRLAIVMMTSLALPVPPMALAATAGEGSDSYPLTLTAGPRLTVAARINGRPVTALLDSAAEATLLDHRLANELKLGHGETVAGQGSGQDSFEASLVGGVTLETLGRSLPDQTVFVTDLTDINRRLKLGHVEAILGREIFDAARLFIDIEGQHIAVVSRDKEPRGVRLELVTEHGVETLPARIEGGAPVRATYDLGNGSKVLISSALAAHMGLLSDGRSVSTERGGGLGGETVRQVVTLRTLEIAGRKFHNVPAAIDHQASASDLNVGISVLRKFRITTDYANHVVWLESRD